jgi:hypothetical protein
MKELVQGGRILRMIHFILKGPVGHEGEDKARGVVGCVPIDNGNDMGRTDGQESGEFLTDQEGWGNDIADSGSDEFCCDGCAGLKMAELSLEMDGIWEDFCDGSFPDLAHASGFDRGGEGDFTVGGAEDGSRGGEGGVRRTIEGGSGRSAPSKRCGSIQGRGGFKKTVLEGGIFAGVFVGGSHGEERII